MNRQSKKDIREALKFLGIRRVDNYLESLAYLRYGTSLKRACLKDELFATFIISARSKVTTNLINALDFIFLEKYDMSPRVIETNKLIIFLCLIQSYNKNELRSLYRILCHDYKTSIKYVGIKNESRINFSENSSISDSKLSLQLLSRMIKTYDLEILDDDSFSQLTESEQNFMFQYLIDKYLDQTSRTYSYSRIIGLSLLIIIEFVAETSTQRRAFEMVQFLKKEGSLSNVDLAIKITNIISNVSAKDRHAPLEWILALEDLSHHKIEGLLK